MHELLLYGQLPAARHEQLMNVLAGLTAMQPHRVTERHVLFQPTHGPVQAQVQKGGTQGLYNKKPKQAPQGQQSRDLNYTHLVKVLDEDEFAKGSNAMDVDGHVTEDDEEKRFWQWQFRNLPEGGKRSATFRMAEDIDITAGDPQAYMEGLGYR
jgi:mediator of RNA polymerase II transcription subunit 18, fungi type